MTPAASSSVRASGPVRLYVVPARVDEDRGGRLGDVVLGDGRDATGAGGTADDAVGLDELGQEVEVEVVAEQHRGQPARAEVLLGGPVVARQGEGRRGGRPEEGDVDESAHAGGGRRVDERPVLLDAIGGLGAGDHEDRLHPVEGGPDQLGVVVRAPDGDGAREIRGTLGAPDGQPLGYVARGEQPRHAPAEASRRSRDRDPRPYVLTHPASPCARLPR